MKNLKKVFRNIENGLEKSKWFTEGWEIYNRGAYLQLYKGNWHNHKQGGVHFETYIEGSQIKQKEFPICMHAEEDCPKQNEFVQRFIANVSDRIKSWKGYQVIGKGYQIYERVLPLNFKNLELKILEEFNRMRQLEHEIDRLLLDLEG